MIKFNNQVKIYGLPRSGTNFLEFMLINNLNLNVRILFEGWKHGEIKSDIPGVFIVKNPFHWIFSIFNFAKIRPQIFNLKLDESLDQFIRGKYRWVSDISGKGSEIVVQEAENPIQHWNNMNLSWMNKAFAVNYEELYSSPQKTLTNIKEHLINKNVSCSLSTHIVWPDSAIKPGQARHVGKKNENSFIIDDYMINFNDDMKGFIKNELDSNLCRKLNYNQL